MAFCETLDEYLAEQLAYFAGLNLSLFKLWTQFFGCIECMQ